MFWPSGNGFTLLSPFKWPDREVVNPSVWIRAGQNYASSLIAQGHLTQLYRPPLFPLHKDWCFAPGKGLFEKGGHLTAVPFLGQNFRNTFWSVEEKSFADITPWSDLMLTSTSPGGHFKENASVGSFYDVHVWGQNCLAQIAHSHTVISLKPNKESFISVLTTFTVVGSTLVSGGCW